MSKLGQRLLHSAAQAEAISRGEHVPGAVIHTPVDVAAIRVRLGLTQEAFAERFGLLASPAQFTSAPAPAARKAHIVWAFLARSVGLSPPWRR